MPGGLFERLAKWCNSRRAADHDAVSSTAAATPDSDVVQSSAEAASSDAPDEDARSEQCNADPAPSAPTVGKTSQYAPLGQSEDEERRPKVEPDDAGAIGVWTAVPADGGSVAGRQDAREDFEADASAQGSCEATIAELRGLLAHIKSEPDDMQERLSNDVQQLEGQLRRLGALRADERSPRGRLVS